VQVGDDKNSEFEGMTQIETFVTRIVAVGVDGILYGRQVVKVCSMIDLRNPDPRVVYETSELDGRVL
jgi:hypothetical protein